jgi:hypothetical protein
MLSPTAVGGTRSNPGSLVRGAVLHPWKASLFHSLGLMRTLVSTWPVAPGHQDPPLVFLS